MTIATKLKHAKRAFDVFNDVLFARCHKFMVAVLINNYQLLISVNSSYV